MCRRLLLFLALEVLHAHYLIGDTLCVMFRGIFRSTDGELRLNRHRCTRVVNRYLAEIMTEAIHRATTAAGFNAFTISL
jgi:hypothetical protein